MNKKIIKKFRTYLPDKLYHSVRVIYKNVQKRTWKEIGNDFFQLRLLKHAKRLKEKNHQVVVIGDSHACFFAGNVGIKRRSIHHDGNGAIQYSEGPDRRFCVLNLGPGLAYNVGKYGTTARIQEKVDWLNKDFIKPDDTIICSFGEIDIRTHVFKHVDENKTYQEVVDSILDNYIMFLLRLGEESRRKVVAWGPIASQKDRWITNPEFPRAGSEQERNRATEYFNYRLKKECEKNDIVYMSIFNKLVNKDYRTKAEYIFDQCHLGQNARTFLEDELVRVRLRKGRGKIR